MNPPTESPNPSSSVPHLEQVDPPHPFRSRLKTLGIAAAVVILAIAILVYFVVRKPPVSAGQVLEVNYYPVHTTESAGAGDTGMHGDTGSYDQLLVLARVRVRDQTNIPLFLEDIAASVILSDGSQQTSVAASSADAARLFDAYPALDQFRSATFNRDATVNAGQSTEGLAIFSFSMTRQQWDSRKSADIVVSLIHQDDLVINFPR